MTPTEQQRRAIESEERNKFIDAVPGSGKSMVLIERAAHFIGKGIAANQITFVTFTISAAAELQRRLNVRLGAEVKLQFVGTSHALMARILADVGRRVPILSEEESKLFIKDVYLERYPTEKKQDKCSFKKVLKLMQKGPGYFDCKKAGKEEEITALQTWKKMQSFGIMNFAALLYAGLNQIRRTGYVTECLFWDEAQDSDAQEFAIMTAIQAEWKTIVADRNQSIFFFRGACPEMLDKLTK